MAVPVMVMITVFVHVIAINRLMWAHGRHEASSRRVIIYASAPRSHNHSAPPHASVARPQHMRRECAGPVSLRGI